MYKIDVKTKDAGILRATATATVTDTETKPPRVVAVVTTRSWAGRIAAGMRAAGLARAAAEQDRTTQLNALLARKAALTRLVNAQH